MHGFNRRLFVLGGAAFAAAAAGPGAALARQTCRITDGTRQCHSRLRHSLVVQSARRQHRSQWCWAAALSMVFAYYGRPVSQERIVRETWGKVTNMPRHVDDVMRDINRNWTDDRGRAFRASGRRLTLHHIELPRRAAQALAANRPLIVGSLGHAMVLTEMRWEIGPDGQLFVSDIIVSDPANGARRNLTLAERLETNFVAAVDIRAR